jgi:hypothetical protein
VRANSNNWQQILAIHPNSNRGTENNNQNNFDASGNLLTSILPSVKTGLQSYSGTSYSMGGESDEDT